MKPKSLIARNRQKTADTWDLRSLFPDDAAWEAEFTAWEAKIPQYEQFQGTLGDGADRLAAALEFDLALDRQAERLGTYAFLKTAEDTTVSAYQRMQGRFVNAASRAAAAASFLRPEILAIPDARMQAMRAEAALAPYQVLLDRILRDKPHTLTRAEERLLALQTEMAQAAEQTFHQLHDADLRFGHVRDASGRAVELTHGTFSTMLHSPKRSVRKAAFHRYYAAYDAHRHTLAATLCGSIQRDVYYARARNFAGSLDAALFPDAVPRTVYEQLIAAVRAALPSLHRYYNLRRRRMKIKTIHHYDTYVPILAELESRHTWDQAVALVLKSLEPLGADYCGELERGLRGRWCDRYENRGKQSGAFSCGSYDGWPYILMNYQPGVLDHVFTLAHEAGHSMHSLYSSRAQPYAYYHYATFVAEVASTFNEQLLGRRMLDEAKDDRRRAYLINREIDSIRATLFRQTMFAEFEKNAHELAESNEPLTVDSFQDLYRELLAAYFGPEFTLDDCLALECFRIPHFYRAFYVYKYATGMSAAIALADGVLSGSAQSRAAYLDFLKSGCAKFPLELLRDAGVDMETPAPVAAAMQRFDRLVDELDGLL